MLSINVLIFITCIVVLTYIGFRYFSDMSKPFKHDNFSKYRKMFEELHQDIDNLKTGGNDRTGNDRTGNDRTGNDVSPPNLPNLNPNIFIEMDDELTQYMQHISNE